MTWDKVVPIFWRIKIDPNLFAICIPNSETKQIRVINKNLDSTILQNWVYNIWLFYLSMKLSITRIRILMNLSNIWITARLNFLSAKWWQEAIYLSVWNQIQNDLKIDWHCSSAKKNFAKIISWLIVHITSNHYELVSM